MLDIQIERGDDHAVPAVRRFCRNGIRPVQQRIHGMGSFGRQIARAAHAQRRLGKKSSPRAGVCLAPQRMQAPAGRVQLFLPAGKRAARGGMLRHERQRHDFRQAEGRRLLGKVYPGRRARSLDIAAVGGEIEVRLQDLPLGVMPLQNQRPPDLAQLARNTGAVDVPGHAGHLHGQGGSPHAAFPGQRTPCGPDQSRKADAGMRPEGPILIQQRGLAQFGGHGVQRREYPVFFVSCQAHAQHAAFPVDKHAGKVRSAVQIGTGRPEQREKKHRRQKQCRRGRRRNTAHAATAPEQFFHQKFLCGLRPPLQGERLCCTVLTALCVACGFAPA